MREYNSYTGKVDLDNPETYSHLPKDTKAVRDLIYRKIGYVICYMDYFPERAGLFPKEKSEPEFVDVEGYEGGKVDIANVAYEQRLRVYDLIKKYSENRRENQNNLLWLQEMYYLLNDETENMC